MSRWVPPVLAGLVAPGRIFGPRRDVREVAGVLCDLAWKGAGVRVFRWPCGTMAAIRVGSRADDVLLSECEQYLFVTYARLHVPGTDKRGDGPTLVDVLHDLHWARATAA